MLHLNRVQFFGRMGTDPVLAVIPGTEAKVVAMDVALTTVWREGGERRERVDFHFVEFPDRLADIAMRGGYRGAPILVEGELVNDFITDSTGAEHRTSIIVAKQLQFLEARRPAPAKAQASTSETASEAPSAAPAAPVASPAAETPPAPAPAPSPVSAPVPAAAETPTPAQTPAPSASPARSGGIPARLAAARQRAQSSTDGAAQTQSTMPPAPQPESAAPATAPVSAPAQAATQAPVASQAPATPVRKWTRGINRAAAAATA